jgi:spermidine synthase
MALEKRKMIENVFTKNSELQLWKYEHGEKEEFEIIINGVFIMATYNSGSSEFLIRNAVSRIEEDGPLSVLIAGFGMGFTVSEACRDERIKSIDVVEMEEVIVDWNKRYFKTFEQSCFDSERVKLYIDDFYKHAINSKKSYDIVCIDIDNGPMLLVNEGNEKVYTCEFMRVVAGVLNKDGICVIWSCDRDRRLEQSMEDVFDQVEIEELTEKFKGRDVSYYLYFGRKRDLK